MKAHPRAVATPVLASKKAIGNAPLTTKAGDWWQARLRGERLPEHELPEPGDTCELCFRPMHAEEIDRDLVASTGFLICNECVEATLASAVNAGRSVGLVGKCGGRS